MTEYGYCKYGLCQCDCGKLAPLATYTHQGHGYVEGEPVLFINGHSWTGRKRNLEPEYKVDSFDCLGLAGYYNLFGP